MDGDGVPNGDDVCEFSPFGGPVNPSGRPMGDAGDDYLVTLDDYAFFEACLSVSGPDGDPESQDCVDVFDFDADVDLRDFVAFQLVLGGL